MRCILKERLQPTLYAGRINGAHEQTLFSVLLIKYVTREKETEIHPLRRAGCIKPIRQALTLSTC